MAAVVLYDANVLYPSTLRDLLIRIADAGLVQAKWTEHILDEAFGRLATNRPDLDPQKLARTRELMCQAVPDCIVTDYESLIDAVTLPDPHDRHVLAAAIRCRAQVIVTANLKDFPTELLGPWHVVGRHPDDFLLDQIELDHEAVVACVRDIAASRRNPPQSYDDVQRARPHLR